MQIPVSVYEYLMNHHCNLSELRAKEMVIVGTLCLCRMHNIYGHIVWL